ncbi:PREDICTED: hemogen isoform X2 [Gavialis gangeticus]|uniref:hemogen isoform X2 n=1 Tax=Gavialis gangeticus TaxID=94835 RepID=UPI00092F733B|nr:PREDICTED: hemogen isoform X2 [Gavialis gangeticus]
MPSLQNKMEGIGKDHAYSEPDHQPPPASEEYVVPGNTLMHHENYAVQDVIITRRLRDRELLRKRKTEAQEKDTIQEEKNKRQKRGRGAGRGRGRPLVTQPEPQHKESENELSEQAQTPQEHPVITVQELPSGTLQEAVEGISGEGNLFAAEQKEAPGSAEGEILEDLNTPLENDYQDNEYCPSALF